MGASKISVNEIHNRVVKLEENFMTMNTDIQTLKSSHDVLVQNTSDILEMVSHSKNVARFVQKWGWPVLSAAATAGFFNPKITAFISALFS